MGLVVVVVEVAPVVVIVGSEHVLDKFDLELELLIAFVFVLVLVVLED